MTGKEAKLFFKKADHRGLFSNAHIFVCTLSSAIWGSQFCLDLELQSAPVHPHNMRKGHGNFFCSSDNAIRIHKYLRFEELNLRGQVWTFARLLEACVWDGFFGGFFYFI